MSDLKASIEDDVAVLKASMDELKAVISEFAVAARLEWPGPLVALDAGDGNWISVAELILSREPRVANTGRGSPRSAMTPAAARR